MIFTAGYLQTAANIPAFTKPTTFTLSDQTVTNTGAAVSQSTRTPVSAGTFASQSGSLSGPTNTLNAAGMLSIY